MLLSHDIWPYLKIFNYSFNDYMLNLKTLDKICSKNEEQGVVSWIFNNEI